jgi:replicative DNA helicase
LPYDDAKAAAPRFCQTHTNDVELRREKTEQCVRGRVKMQRRRDEVDEWRRGLQLDAREIAISS